MLHPGWSKGCRQERAGRRDNRTKNGQHQKKAHGKGHLEAAVFLLTKKITDIKKSLLYSCPLWLRSNLVSRSYRFYHFSRFNISFLITSGTWWFRLPLFQKEYNGHLPVPAVLSLSSQPSHNFHTVPSELCAQSLSFHIVSALQLLDREESFLLRKGRIKVGWHLRLLKMMERLMWFDSIEWKVYGVRV